MEFVLAMILGLLLWLFVMGIFAGCIVGVIYLFSLLIENVVKPALNRKKEEREERQREEEAEMLRDVQDRPHAPTKKPVKKEEKEERTVSPTLVLKAIEKADEYIQDSEISSQLQDCKNLLERIGRFDEKEVPAHMKKMYTLYLPSLLKVLKQYADLEALGHNDALPEMKKKIQSLTETVNTALQEHLQETQEKNVRIMDADMRALEALLKSDGITEMSQSGQDCENLQE